MKNFLSRTEADELCDSLVRPFCGEGGISRVDIDSFVKKALRCPVFYESFAEKDLDKIGFCGDGQTPLQVYRNGKPAAIVFPKEASCWKVTCFVRMSRGGDGLHWLMKRDTC